MIRKTYGFVNYKQYIYQTTMANIEKYKITDYINNQKGVQINIRFVQIPIDEGKITELFTVFRRNYISIRTRIMPEDKIRILFSTNLNMAKIII